MSVICGEVGCEKEATKRAGFDCCMEYALVCDEHAKAIAEWRDSDLTRESECVNHGNIGFMFQTLKIRPL